MPDDSKGNTKEKERMVDTTEGTVQILEDAAPARLDLDVCRTTTPNISVRAATEGEDGDMPVLEGHFSTFNDWYEINSFFEGHFMERIAPGAFKRTFNAAKSSKDLHRVQVLLEHGFDPQVGDKPLGVHTALEEDSEGARYEVELFDTSYVRDLLPALKAGVYGSSFRFQVLNDEWAEPGSKKHSGESDIPERTIKEVRVAEFGPTVFPANPNATAGTRSTTDEFYEKVLARNSSKYEEVLARAAKARGAVPSDENENKLSDEDVTETTETPTGEGDTHPVDESPNEDSLSEHSEDSRNAHSDEDPSIEHSEDPQDDSTLSGEGEPTSEKQEEEVESMNKSCDHAFCEKRRTGKNTERQCFFKHD